MKYIKGTRITLQSISSKDFVIYKSILGDSDISEKMILEKKSDEAHQKDFEYFVNESARTNSTRNSHFYFIKSNIDKKFVGIVNINISTRKLNSGIGNIGYGILKEHRNKGYATEAVTMFLDYGFDQLKLHKIVSTPLGTNKESIKLLKRVGMKRDALLRKECYYHGDWEDIVIYSKLRNE